MEKSEVDLGAAIFRADLPTNFKSKPLFTTMSDDIK